MSASGPRGFTQSHLYLWVSNALLAEGLDVVKS